MEQVTEKPLKPKMIKAINMLVYRVDMNNADIIRELKIAESTLYEWFKNPSFSKTLKEETEKYLSFLGSKAIKKINKLSESDDIPASVQYQASKDLADRGIGKPVDKVEQVGDLPVYNFTIVAASPSNDEESTDNDE